MYEITLRAMRFHTIVGILPHEREVAQPLEIDLMVRVAEGDGVVDYRSLYDLAAMVASHRMMYLEGIAERVVLDALAHNSRIRFARAAVRKPHVALPGPLDYAEVVFEKSAGD